MEYLMIVIKKTVKWGTPPDTKPIMWVFSCMHKDKNLSELKDFLRNENFRTKNSGRVF